MSRSSVTVVTPGTTANLGPGFDCLGAALTIYNQFQLRLSSQKLQITVGGKPSTAINNDENNLLYQAFTQVYRHLDKKIPGIEIDIQLGVPLARGLGSSATAIVGGLVAANYLLDNPLSTKEIMHLAIVQEGHPDNVVPTLLGNCQLAVQTDGDWSICPIPWAKEIAPIVVIPDFELSTQAARSVLPKELSYGDAVYNAAHLGLLIRGLATQQIDWLHKALSDRLHQPYRETLIPGYNAVKSAALEAGAYGLVISGAGPTLLALAPQEKAEAVASATVQTWQSQGIKAEAKALELDTQGTRILA